MPGESVYSIENVKLEGLIDRGIPYQINLTAVAKNCEAKSTVINLYVLNKTNTILTLLDVKGIHLQGQSMRIQARLINATSSMGIPNATIRFSFGGVLPERIALTDNDGIATIEISIPTQSFTVEASFDETSSIAKSYASPVSITVITYVDILMWIGIIAAICIASIFAVRQFYLKPKRRRKEQEYQKIANKFMDIANLRHLLVLHQESSACIFQQSVSEELDANLISGFLSAISSFQAELKPEKLPQATVKTGGFELNYQDYKILVFQGDLINIALIFEEPPSDDFRERVQAFVKEYEDRYRQHLVAFRGNVTPFKDSAQFIADKLELSLIWPHQLYRPGAGVKLSSMNESLIQIADTIMKSQAIDYFFLPLVISMAQAAMNKSKLEIIAAVYDLRKRTIFRPITYESSGN